MKRIISLLLLGTIFVASTFTLNAEAKATAESKIKNVILLIPDGQSVDVTTLARWYNGGGPLAIDALICGLVRTYSSDAAIADSAPAATAMATGFKAHTGFVGVLPDKNSMPNMSPIKGGDARRPIATVLEAARLAGKSTGLVATSEFMHATVAAFSAHDISRKNYDNLSEQQVYQGIDVVLGAGEFFLTKEGRKDGTDLISVIKDKGYDYITTIEGFKNSSAKKVWGMFAPKDLDYEFDRDPQKQPSIAEMTAKAIDILSENKKGFFLMVEGSKIDWATHANDPIGAISDSLAFDDAVRVALNFAKSNEDTVIISVTDHGVGGLTMGNSATDNTYDVLPLETFIAPLKKATLTGEGVEKMLNKKRTNIKEVMAKYYGVTDLSSEEIAEIKKAKAGSMNYTVGPIISKRASLAWTTHGHTGEDVPLAVYAPKNCEKLVGVVENSDIGKYIARLMDFDLEKTTKHLFVPAKAAFEKKGASFAWNTSDEKNPSVIVKKNGTTIELFINTNNVRVNGKEKALDGVIVYNGINVYAPQMAIDLIQ